MGPEDRPESLAPASRERYFEYAERKQDRGEIPRTPLGWEQVSSYWRMQWIQGRGLERGAGVVFGLPQAGWKPEQALEGQSGRKIKADWSRPGRRSRGEVAHHLEFKSGIMKDRDIQQLKGYQARLMAGERVTHVTRESKEMDQPLEARQLIAQLERQFPGQFVHKTMSDRVYYRLLEAGVRQLEKDFSVELENNLGRLPAREQKWQILERIAHDYARDIQEGKERGEEVGIEQLRFMNSALREMAQVLAKVERDQARQDRKDLKLGYHAGREVDHHQREALDAREGSLARAIDPVTYELLDRERALIAAESDRIADRIIDARNTGQTLDLEREQGAYLGVAHAQEKVREMELRFYREQARDLPKERAEQFVRDMGAIAQERDEAVTTRIELIGKAVDVERERREAAERQAQARAAEQQTREDRRRALMEQGVTPEILRIMGLGEVDLRSQRREPETGRSASGQSMEQVARDLQAQGISPESARLVALGNPTLPEAAVEREPPPAPRPTRGRDNERDLERGQERDTRGR